MSIQKKSLISALKTTKKANVASSSPEAAKGEKLTSMKTQRFVNAKGSGVVNAKGSGVVNAKGSGMVNAKGSGLVSMKKGAGFFSAKRGFISAKRIVE